MPASLQEKIIDILTLPQQQLEQQAFETAQSGSLPDPPSFEAIKAQQAEQAQQLRSVLGDAEYAQFTQYQASIPDRIIIDQMNQEGANLSENQSNELLKVLTEARQQISIQAGTTQNLSAMSPDEAMTTVQQQQTLLQQAVNNRAQAILTPDQKTTLQGVLSRLSVRPKSQ
ncbi:MAG TPA: hypothetical protein VK673_09260 [Chthoniobacterales bacterium]|nr:hypothetical protein [Chthoniobacterales bacterium]